MIKLSLVSYRLAQFLNFACDFLGIFEALVESECSTEVNDDEALSIFLAVLDLEDMNPLSKFFTQAVYALDCLFTIPMELISVA